MLKLLTAGQLHILARAKGFFEDRLATQNVRSMFREEAGGLSVGLAFSEDGQTFIVRQTIGCDWTDVEIGDALSRLIIALAVSIAKVRLASEAA